MAATSKNHTDPPKMLQAALTSGRIITFWLVRDWTKKKLGGVVPFTSGVSIGDMCWRTTSPLTLTELLECEAQLGQVFVELGLLKKYKDDVPKLSKILLKKAI